MRRSDNATKRFSRGATVLILVITAAAVVAAVAVANSLTAPSPENSKVIVGSAQTTPPPEKELIGSRSPANALNRVRAKVAVLRGVADSADTLPTAIRQSGAARNQIQPGSGRLLRKSRSGERFFAVPVYGGGELPLDDVGVCLFDQHAAGTCTSIADVTQGQSIVFADHLPELPDGYARLTGMVPDGVSEVIVALSDGTTLDLSVQNNLYLHEGVFKPTSVSWTIDEKKYSQVVPGA